MRPLLPQPPSDRDLDGTGTPQWTPVPGRKRGKQVGLACDACKKRKSKCDGIRPTCSACRVKHSQCYFDDANKEANTVKGLRRQLEGLQEMIHILNHLRSCPEDEAQLLLRRLRSGGPIRRLSASSDTDSLASRELFEDVEASISATSLSVESRAKQDYFDHSSSQTCHHSQGSVAPGAADVPTEELGSERQMWASCSFGAEYLTEIRRGLAPPEVRRCKDLTWQFCDVVASRDRIRSRHSPYSCIPRATWTEVDIRDDLFSHLICLWLSYHAFCSPYVQPILFLEALSLGRPSRDCSQLLVSAVLAIACQRSFEDCQAARFDSLSSTFYNEACRRWQQEQSRPSLTTIQALLAMSEYNNYLAKPKESWRLLEQAVRMGMDMGLYSDCAEIRSRQVLGFNQRFVAWSLFAFQRFQSFSDDINPLIQQIPDARPEPPQPIQENASKWRPFAVCEGVMRESYYWQHWEQHCLLTNILATTTSGHQARNPSNDQARNPMGLDDIKLALHRLEEWKANLPSVLNLDTNEMPHNLRLHAKYNFIQASLARELAQSMYPKSLVIDSLHGDEVSAVSFLAARNVLRLAAIGFENYSDLYSAGYDRMACYVAATVVLETSGQRETRETLLQALRLLDPQSRYSTCVFAAQSALMTILSAADGR